MVQNLDESIRATLIVSDNLGYELVRDMTETGISFNKTICNVLIVNNGNDTATLVEKIKAYNKAEEKNKEKLIDFA